MTNFFYRDTSVLWVNYWKLPFLNNIYIYAHENICLPVNLYTYLAINQSNNLYIYLYIYLFIYLSIYIYIYVCVCMYVCVCVLAVYNKAQAQKIANRDWIQTGDFSCWNMCQSLIRQAKAKWESPTAMELGSRTPKSDHGSSKNV